MQQRTPSACVAKSLVKFRLLSLLVLAKEEEYPALQLWKEVQVHSLEAALFSALRVLYGPQLAEKEALVALRARALFYRRCQETLLLLERGFQFRLVPVRLGAVLAQQQPPPRSFCLRLRQNSLRFFLLPVFTPTLF